MNIAILDDYADMVRSFECFAKLRNHRVTVWNDHTKDVDTLAARLADTEALVLLREFNHDHGSACLIVTHDPRLAARCDRQIVLVDGQLTTPT